ncbi:GNAT family N-acetyltransferase [Parasalinivibrio latis]|uniref:GNAT family N-acetyltransferase n=1 Tax=Parasalinivibrio latis TaxID=2952610 RepID=UPI0030DF08A3
MKIINLTEQPDVIPVIAKWHFDEWGHLYPGETLADFVQGLHQCLDDSLVPVTWLLVDEQNVVGTASLVEQDMETNIELGPWLANVYLIPAIRGQGIGSWLIREVMSLAKQRGISELVLFTEGQSWFYETLGWQVLKTETYHGETVSVMGVNLASL